MLTEVREKATFYKSFTGGTGEVLSVLGVVHATIL